MGLISAIKSVLGIGDTGGRSRDVSTGTTVTVEREADATSERAVKKSDTTEVTFEDEPEASSETSTDDPDADIETEATDEDAQRPETPDEQDGETPDPHDGEGADGVSVDDIKGIGPTYAERLADAGVHTVSGLAAADAAELGSEIGVGETRVASWIERASDR